MVPANALCLLWIWAGLFLSLTNLAYFIYLTGGYTQRLWAKGIWFSENDVLHVLVLLWLLYVGVVVVKQTKDYPLAEPALHPCHP